MKIVDEDVDLEDFEAWDGGRDRLDELIRIGTVKKAQQEIEELFPKGITDTQLNDWLWFDVEDQHPEWFNDDWDEMQEVIHRIDEIRASGKPWFESSDGAEVFLSYETDEDDARVFKLEADMAGGNAGTYAQSEVDYDFSKSLEDNMSELKARLMVEDQVYEKLPDGMEYVESFPCWAATYCMYGDESGLSREDVELADQWMLENGYGDLVSLDEGTHASFDHPAFGAACDTETAVFSVSDKPIFVISYDDDDGNEHYLENETNSFTARRFYSEEDAMRHISDVLGGSDKYVVLKVYDPKPEERPDGQDARP